jgi:hypothetical protein
MKKSNLGRRTEEGADIEGNTWRVLNSTAGRNVRCCVVAWRSYVLKWRNGKLLGLLQQPPNANL